MPKSHFRKIFFSSGAVRFHVKEGWTFEEVVKMSLDGSRIIYFKDDYPYSYFISDRLDVEKVMRYQPIPIYTFKEDAKNDTRTNILIRNI